MTDETHLGDVCVADLDAKSAFVAGRGIEATADAMEKLDKKGNYSSAVSFLRQFAGVLYDYSTKLSQAAKEKSAGSLNRMVN